ncbi:HEPN domain-containing protein [Anaeromicropila herbilytica]|uniref:Uncharacterized protein n=1 Tax=Anaeromicropila herbilytica TaxID=2785025 RepID=A0A7R7EK74_9FIRM|nr:HEPN domain-containing protein [Anaeromicropila herbilytica]BCN30386.1 hypothetical protein bsdtb5_16810 [Anaeromicropila herbilytica]
MISVSLKNMILKDNEEYCFNPYFCFRNNDTRDSLALECSEDDEESCESSQSIIRYALDLAFPELFLRTYCKEGYAIWISRPMLNSYANHSYSPSDIFQLDEDKMDDLRRWFDLLVEYSYSTKEHIDNLVSPWNKAFNEYRNAIDSTNVEKAYMHLVAALEALFRDSNSEVQFKVTLYTSLIYSEEKMDRKRVKSLLKKAYDIRGNLMLGEIRSMKELANKEALYHDYFELKKIVSSVLYKTYGLTKEEILDLVEDNVFESHISLKRSVL